MPNGHREPYRLRGGPVTGSGARNFAVAVDLPGFETPTPVHTSDSEETWANKLEWAAVARRVLARWRLYVRRRLVGRWLENVFFKSRAELRFVVPHLRAFLCR